MGVINNMPDMTKMFQDELRKIKNMPRFTLYSFAYLSEIEAVKERLRIAGIKYRTVPVHENGVIVGYKVYVEN